LTAHTNTALPFLHYSKKWSTMTNSTFMARNFRVASNEKSPEIYCIAADSCAGE